MRRTGCLLVVVAWLAPPVEGQLWEVGNQLLWQPGGSSLANFGEAFAVGDFDADGYDDLAVGGSGASSGGSYAGRVDVYHGGPDGLSTAVWFTVTGAADERFGRSLAAGDFDDDPRDELAVGVPDADMLDGENLRVDAGSVRIYQLVGDTWTATATFSQVGAVPGAAEANDHFGFSLSAGNFDGDAFDDLAVGATGEAVGALGAAGAVNVLYGAAAGLGTSGSQIWHYSGGGVTGTAAAGDAFGSALTSGDFDGDGMGDLAASAPYRTVSGNADAGTVVVLYGTGAGLDDVDQQELDLADLGFALDDSLYFGHAIGAGEINFSFSCAVALSCADDLVIGVPGQSAAGSDDYGDGRFHVVPGDGSDGVDGLDPTAATAFDENSIGGTLDGEDLFGARLAVGPVDGRPNDDVVVGIPNDDGARGAAGLLSGGSLALSGAPAQRLRATAGFLSAPIATDDRFGDALAIGDFDGDDWGDLAIGIPQRDTPDAFEGGAVQVLYGALFADGFERGNRSAWGP